jgi:benzoyl-CoA reductase/2-hydroxyglutaryl-CoA dehydratase subunit BcrC/BadD/HgdB
MNAQDRAAIFRHLPSSPADEVAWLRKEKKKGRKVVGIYCEYAPRELVHAAGAIPACLCAVSQETSLAAEEELPSNLCPIIKSSYGFIRLKSCPIFENCDAIVAETTCDGKKKMYELIRDRHPQYVLELTQKPGDEEAFRHWLCEISRLRTFLEEALGTKITDEALRASIRTYNAWRDRLMKLNRYSVSDPVFLAGSERILINFRMGGGPVEAAMLDDVFAELDRRVKENDPPVKKGAARILVTGVPVGLKVAKVIELLEECGGVMVVQEACTGVKPLYENVSEEGDPLEAIARKYFHLPCSCFTPNDERFRLLDQLADEFRIDGVIDLIWLACHTYNVESPRVREWAKGRNLPFLKVETDFSPSDTEQLRTRIQSFLEIIRS